MMLQSGAISHACWHMVTGRWHGYTRAMGLHAAEPRTYHTAHWQGVKRVLAMPCTGRYGVCVRKSAAAGIWEHVETCGWNIGRT